MEHGLGSADLRAWVAALPVEHTAAGTQIMTAGETSGRILILEAGEVEVVRDEVRIAAVADPGAIFGEL